MKCFIKEAVHFLWHPLRPASYREEALPEASSRDPMGGCPRRHEAAQHLCSGRGYPCFCFHSHSVQEAYKLFPGFAGEEMWNPNTPVSEVTLHSLPVTLTSPPGLPLPEPLGAGGRPPQPRPLPRPGLDLWRRLHDRHQHARGDSGGIMCHVCHVSCVMCHVSRVTCHVSRVTGPIWIRF